MSYSLGLAIESMVSVLLLLTILYCVRLNRQLRMLKADEQSLRVTISELITATEIAERAITGLKQTMRDGEQVLGSRLQRGEEVSAEIEVKMKSAEALLGKLSRIVAVGQPAGEAQVVEMPDPKAVAAAAQAFAERASARLRGLAA